MKLKYVASDRDTYYLGILHVGDFFKLRNYRTGDHPEWSLFLIIEITSPKTVGDLQPQNADLVVRDLEIGIVSRMSGSVRIFLHEPSDMERILAIPFLI